MTVCLPVCHHRRLNCLVDPTPMTLYLPALAGRNSVLCFVLYLDVAA